MGSVDGGSRAVTLSPACSVPTGATVRTPRSYSSRPTHLGCWRFVLAGLAVRGSESTAGRWTGSENSLRHRATRSRLGDLLARDRDRYRQDAVVVVDRRTVGGTLSTMGPWWQELVVDGVAWGRPRGRGCTGAGRSGPGGGPAATDVEGRAPNRRAPGRPPRVRLADFVWKLRTPTSPAAVAAMTIGARLIEGILSISTSGPSSPGLERKCFFVDPVCGALRVSPPRRPCSC